MWYNPTVAPLLGSSGLSLRRRRNNGATQKRRFLLPSLVCSSVTTVTPTISKYQ